MYTTPQVYVAITFTPPAPQSSVHSAIQIYVHHIFVKCLYSSLAEVPSLKLTVRPLKISRAPKKEIHLPTFDFFEGRPYSWRVV